MRTMKTWLALALLTTCLGGAAVGTFQVATGSAQERPRSHWRYHDNHWNYWDANDNRWYYTDGSQWFYNADNAWHPYAFDRAFGRNDFERGDYKVPAAGVKVTLPRHSIWVK